MTPVLRKTLLLVQKPMGEKKRKKKHSFNFLVKKQKQTFGIFVQWKNSSLRHTAQSPGGKEKFINWPPGTSVAFV